MSLGAVFGKYGALCVRARSLGYWREVVRSGECARLSVYALEAYVVFKVRFFYRFSLRRFFFFRAWSDLVMGGRSERLWGVGRSSGIT